MIYYLILTTGARAVLFYVYLSPSACTTAAIDINRQWSNQVELVEFAYCAEVKL